ncbi:MAG: hypothetical protein RBU21_20590 [FCB group bacterium]|nr:hypothetical protein [FCB group bacterium]
MVADYAAHVDRESRFGALMSRRRRAKEGLSYAQFRTSERDRERSGGLQSFYGWKETAPNGVVETAR